MTRSYRRELIDDETVKGADLIRMHDELEAINRHLGGIGSSLRALERIVERPQTDESEARVARNLTVLDVGAGSGDFPRAFAHWCARQGRGGRAVGLDRSAPSCHDASRRAASLRAAPRRAASRHTASRQQPATVTFVTADAFHLPFADGSFDIAHCGLFLHHFDEAAIGRLVREMLRVVRRGVLVNDLHRHALAHGGIRVLTAVLARSRFIRHDAPLSVRRGFLRRELEAIWRAAGLPEPEIRWRWAFRYLIWTARP